MFEAVKKLGWKKGLLYSKPSFVLNEVLIINKFSFLSVSLALVVILLFTHPCRVEFDKFGSFLKIPNPSNRKPCEKRAAAGLLPVWSLVAQPASTCETTPSNIAAACGTLPLFAPASDANCTNKVNQRVF